MALISTDEDPTFQDYVRIFSTRRWIVASFVVVALALSIGYCTLEKPVYTANAQLLLTPILSSSLLQATNPNVSTSQNVVDVPTDTGVIESKSVRNAVEKKIAHPPAVSVSQDGTTNIVTVSVSSTNRNTAARAANEYVHAYLTVEEDQTNSALKSAAHIAESHITAVSAQIAQLDQEIAVATDTKIVVALEDELPTLETQESNYQQELSQYNFYSSLNTGGGQLISSASVPTSPSSPKPVKYDAIAAVLGLVLGLAFVLLLDYFDDRIRSGHDLQKVSGDVPTLATIPLIEEWKDEESPLLVSLVEPQSPASEAYRSLRTAIQFSGLDSSNRLVQFTSPTAADGKTTTLANTAVALSQAGLRTIVVCCDLRRPRIHEFFGLRNDVGFTSVLIGSTSIADALQDVEGCPGLYLLASGPKPPNPSELLASNRARQLLTSLAETADIVLIDSPPILPVTDPTVLARLVDSVVVVVSMGSSTRTGVKMALENLARVGASVTGLVLNRGHGTEPYAYYRRSYTDSSESTVA